MTAVVWVWTNNTNAALASSITNSQTTITLTSGQGAQFPSLSAGQQFVVTIQSASNSSTQEIAYCTARSSDALTVVRAQEGTTGQAFNAGDTVRTYLTAGPLANYAQFPQLALAYANSYLATGQTSTSLTIASFTAPRAGIVIVSGNVGISGFSGSQILNSFAISGSGYTTIGGTSNVGESTSGALNYAVTVAASAAVSIGLSATCSGASNIGIGGTALFIPTA